MAGLDFKNNLQLVRVMKRAFRQCHLTEMPKQNSKDEQEVTKILTKSYTYMPQNSPNNFLLDK